jgi:predicted dehydrogenase
MPDVILVALAEPDEGRRNFAHRSVPQAAAYPDYSELLELSELDAVVICSPTQFHAATAKAALTKGKAVYLEKPLASNLREAEEVVKIWKDSGKAGMVGFNYRFHPFYKTAKEKIQSGVLGRIISIRSIFSSHSKQLPEWKQNRSSGGGALLEIGSHHLDLIPFLTGQRVVKVFAQIQSNRSEGDTASIHLDLSNGTVVQSLFSLNASDEDRIEIYGDTSKLSFDRYLSFHIHFARAELRPSPADRILSALKSIAPDRYLFRKVIQPRREPSYRTALQYFVETVVAHRSPVPDFEDAYRCMMVVDAAEESARTGKVIRVE